MPIALCLYRLRSAENGDFLLIPRVDVLVF